MAELLAPAGEPDAGYAALEYGADAVYLGLDRFSARAEAVNFTPDDLAEFVLYAHSLTPRRRVYCTLNTLVQQAELADALLTLLDAAACGVDAVIVQDAGIATMIRERFPALSLHASTQMAIHNLDGALAAKKLGFRRVTLARELTLAEVAAIAQGVGPDMEIETFIHGTLCYSYSGLCLFSSMLTGRSGNRGRCVYSCREAAECGAAGGTAHPFSLKDMALGPRVLDLVKAGVASLKIEGRKKSPLYVAATVDYYRKILDGKLQTGEAEEYEARLKTIFARPWTKLFIDSPRNSDAADPQVVGHRGSALGTVKALVRTPAGQGISFVPAMAVERHDGLQIDVPGSPRPFGFPVNHLYRMNGSTFSSTYAAGSGEMLAVALPDDAPPLSPGLPLYLSSSQAVKRSYPFSRPKPGLFALKHPADIAVSIETDGNGEIMPAVIRCTAAVSLPPPWRTEGSAPIIITASAAATLDAFPARDATGAEKAAHTSFSRLGESRFRLEGWQFHNPARLFLRQGEWNQLRRELMELLEKEVAEKEKAVRRALAASFPTVVPAPCSPREEKREWSVAVDRVADMAGFAAADFDALAEIIVNISYENRLLDQAGLTELAQKAGHDKIRLALPLIMRGNEVARIHSHVDALMAAGFTRWLVPGWAGWHWLAGREEIDIAADWSLYIFNRQSAKAMAEQGFSAFTLSPEDSRDNMAAILAEYGKNAWVLAYADVPLFIAAACAHAHLGMCKPEKGKETGICRAGNGPLPIRMERSGNAVVFPQGCGSVVMGERPFSLAGKIPALAAMGAERFRIDLRWKPRTPDQAAAIWRAVKNGGIPDGWSGNFERGIV